MIIEQIDGQWIVRVPDAVVRALGLHSGYPVTLRPLYKNEDALRVATAEMRDRMPAYSFDLAAWDGVTAAQINDHAITLSPAPKRSAAI